MLPQTFTVRSFFSGPWCPRLSMGQVNYSASILVTSILFFIYGHFFEGPRGPSMGRGDGGGLLIGLFVEGWLVAYVLSDVVLPEVYAFRFYVWIWWCVQSFRDCSNIAYCQWSFWTCTSPAFAPLHRGCFISHFFSTAFKSFRMIFFFRFLQSGSSPRVVIGPFCQSSHPWGLISWNEMELHDS